MADPAVFPVTGTLAAAFAGAGGVGPAGGGFEVRAGGIVDLLLAATAAPAPVLLIVVTG